MKLLNIFVIALYLLAVVNSAYLRSYNTNALPKIKELVEKSDYVRTLVSTVQLHLKNGGPTEDVIKFIKEERQKVEGELQALKAEKISEMERYDTEIAKMNADISTMEKQLENTVMEISSLNQELSVLYSERENLQNQLTELENREIAIREARDNDVAAYSQRQARDKRAIEALSKIIPQLEGLRDGSSSDAAADASSFIQKTQQQIDEQLSIFSKNDPIRSLVQVSAKFNKAKLDSVIEKLQSILEAVEANKVRDEQNEKASEGRFNALIKEVTTLKASTSQQLKQVKSTITTKEAELFNAKQTKTRLENNISSTTKLRDSTLVTQEQARKQFDAQIAQAETASDALTYVIEILENDQNLSDVGTNAEEITAEQQGEK